MTPDLTKNIASLVRAPVDGTTVLTVYLVLLVCIPSRLVVSGLGGAGTLANFVAISCGLWWIWEMAHRSVSTGVPSNPVRTFTALFLLAVGISYRVAVTRPINPTERSSADLGLIFVSAWVGLLVLAHDGIPNLDRLRLLLRRMVAAGGALATLGLAQFITGLPLTNAISLPGLVSNAPLDSISSREGFVRPASTALHAIEFSVVIAMLLPLALILALQKDGRGVVRRYYPLVVIVAAIPITISRSAMVGTVVGLLVVIPALSRSARRWLLPAAGVLISAIFVLVPGLLGSLVGLFTGVSTDSSAISRTGSYDIVWEYFTRSPVFGRGFSTFLPSYRILDNGYLGLLLDVGLFGLLMFLGLVLAGVATSVTCRRRASDPDVRQLAQGIAAGITVGGVGMALFDGLGFPMASGFLFLFLGLSGCLWRLVRLEDRAVTPSEAAVPSS